MQRCSGPWGCGGLWMSPTRETLSEGGPSEPSAAGTNCRKVQGRSVDQAALEGLPNTVAPSSVVSTKPSCPFRSLSGPLIHMCTGIVWLGRKVPRNFGSAPPGNPGRGKQLHPPAHLSESPQDLPTAPASGFPTCPSGFWGFVLVGAQQPRRLLNVRCAQCRFPTSGSGFLQEEEEAGLPFSQ